MENLLQFLPFNLYTNHIIYIHSCSTIHTIPLNLSIQSITYNYTPCLPSISIYIYISVIYIAVIYIILYICWLYSIPGIIKHCWPHLQMTHNLYLKGKLEYGIPRKLLSQEHCQIAAVCLS